MLSLVTVGVRAILSSIPVTEFDSDLCGLSSFTCIDQPGNANFLDPLREVVMYRVQYRNFGTHETLVGNLVTDVSGNDDAGVSSRTFGAQRCVDDQSVNWSATRRMHSRRNRH